MAELRTELEQAARQAPPIRGDSLERLVRRRERKSRRGRAAVAVLALALTAVAIGGVFEAFRAHTGTTRDVHAVSGPAMDLTVGPDQYAYQQSVLYSYGPEGDGADWPLYVETATGQAWYRADGSGRQVNDSHLDFFTARDRDTFLQQFGAGAADQIDQHDGTTYDAGTFPTDTGDLSYLSTDPALLKQQLLDRSGPDGRSPEPEVSLGPGAGAEAGRLWAAISDLLRSANASPAQKAGLFEVAEGLQGVVVDLNATDPVGRTAVELGVITEPTVQEWWFDPATEQLLSVRDSRSDTGQVQAIMIVQQSGVTDDVASPAGLVKSFVPAPVTPVPTLADPRH